MPLNSLKYSVNLFTLNLPSLFVPCLSGVMYPSWLCVRTTTPSHKRKWFSRVVRDSSGSSAIEFAIVAAPFLALVFLALQVGLVYFANGELENAVAQGARLIRTGEAQTQNFDAGRFKTEVCKNLTALLSCAHLSLDVRTFSSFGGTNLTNPLDGSGNLKTVGSATSQAWVARSLSSGRFYDWDLPTKFPKAISSIEVSLSNIAEWRPAADRNASLPKRAFQIGGADVMRQMLSENETVARNSRNMARCTRGLGSRVCLARAGTRY